MTLSGNNYTDRHGRPLKVGQQVRIQHCVGRYGQTRIEEGVITEISPYGGVTMECSTKYGPLTGPSEFKYVTITRAGYEKFEDFEHGHEKWTEIIGDTP